MVTEQVLRILESLSAFTDALASESRVSPDALSVVSDILEVINEDCALTIDLKRLMKSDLESRYADVTVKVMELTSFVDPQIKESYVEEASKWTEMTTLSKKGTQTEQTNTTPLHTSKKQHQILADLLKKITSTRQQTSSVTSA
ncbi:zinc finger BED domain-containing protein 1-like [Tachysurus ichikawai]